MESETMAQTKGMTEFEKCGYKTNFCVAWTSQNICCHFNVEFNIVCSCSGVVH